MKKKPTTTWRGIAAIVVLAGGCPHVLSQAARAAGSGAGTAVGGW